MHIDVCIATFKRPVMLERCLASLSNQLTDKLFSYSVCVADNDPDGSARAVCEKYKDACDLSYIIQPIENISISRNTAMGLGQGDYIAILDDDEYAEPNWLLEYFIHAQNSGDEVLHGPVKFFFPPNVNPLLKSPVIFHDETHFKTGEKSGYIVKTTNCFFNRKILDELDIWFDPEYGLSGGEDSDFFLRLKAKNKRFSWCSTAITHEEITAERITLKAMTKRRFRIGRTHAKRDSMTQTPRVRIINFAMNSAWLSVNLILFFLGLILFRRARALKCFFIVAFMTGYMSYFVTRYEFKNYKED